VSECVLPTITRHCIILYYYIMIDYNIAQSMQNTWYYPMSVYGVYPKYTENRLGIIIIILIIIIATIISIVINLVSHNIIIPLLSYCCGFDFSQIILHLPTQYAVLFDTLIWPSTVCDGFRNEYSSIAPIFAISHVN